MKASVQQSQGDKLERSLASDRCWLYGTWGLIGALLVARLAYAAVAPVDLVPDEAYYWDWSRQLDWGYYSKPPMVAWLIALSTGWLGATPFAVRLPAVLLGTLGLFWMYLLAARLYGRRAGFWAALLTAATPGNAALALLMTIDAPFLFCWCGALYCFWQFTTDARPRLLWLLATILITGLGFLSKQTMLGFVPLAFLFLAIGREDRKRLFAPEIWIWAVGSLLFLTPVLLWNIQHDWITAQHTAGHFGGAGVGVAKRLARFGEFVASQFGGGSPVTMALYAAVLALTARRFREIDRRARYLFCFSGLPMIGVLGLALVQRVQPNWPAGFVPAGLVLLCGWALGHVRGIPALRAGPLGLRRAAIVGAACAALTYLLPYGFGMQGSRIDPVGRLRGWGELGRVTDAAWRGLPDASMAFLITTTGRATASELAFYLPAQPPAFVWNPTGQILSQYDVWAKPRGDRGGAALIVTGPEQALPAGLVTAFEAIEPGGEVQVPIGNGRSHHYRIWRGLGFSRWPFGPDLAWRDCPRERTDDHAQTCLSKEIGPRRCNDEGRVIGVGESQTPTAEVRVDLIEQRPLRTRPGSGASQGDASDDLRPALLDKPSDEPRCPDDLRRAVVQRAHVPLCPITARLTDTQPSKRELLTTVRAACSSAETCSETASIQTVERSQKTISQPSKPGGNRIGASIKNKAVRSDHWHRRNLLCVFLRKTTNKSRVSCSDFCHVGQDFYDSSSGSCCESCGGRRAPRGLATPRRRPRSTCGLWCGSRLAAR